MPKKMEVYKCEICGNIVEMLHGGKGVLVCCGKQMIQQAENTVDAAKEKHIPVIESIDGGMKVKVGSVSHPMTDNHFIEWIELIDNKGVHNPRHFLKPGENPETIFKAPADRGWKVRAYCNLHGLWSTEILQELT